MVRIFCRLSRQKFPTIPTLYVFLRRHQVPIESFDGNVGMAFKVLQADVIVYSTSIKVLLSNQNTAHIIADQSEMSRQHRRPITELAAMDDDNRIHESPAGRSA